MIVIKVKYVLILHPDKVPNQKQMMIQKLLLQMLKKHSINHSKLMAIVAKKRLIFQLATVETVVVQKKIFFGNLISIGLQNFLEIST